MLFPKKTKYQKQFKGKLRGLTNRGNKLIFGTYTIKSLETGWITAKQIEATRRAIVRKMQRLGQLWIWIFPDTPITAKPIEIRMGKGKGAVSHWVSKIKKGQILYEISGISSEIAYSALKSGANKLPLKTKIIL